MVTRGRDSNRTPRARARAGANAARAGKDRARRGERRRERSGAPPPRHGGSGRRRCPPLFDDVRAGAAVAAQACLQLADVADAGGQVAVAELAAVDEPESGLAELAVGLAQLALGRDDLSLLLSGAG